MSFKEITNRMFVNFFVIFFLTMSIASVRMWLLGVEDIGLDIIFYYMALSFLTVLPELVFYSKRELSKAQLIVRHLICYVLVVAIVLGFLVIVAGASLSQPIIVIIVAVTVFIVYIISVAIDFLRAAKSTNQLMEKLDERYK